MTKTLTAIRHAEFKAAEAAAPSALEAYWAGSAFASVKRDIRAGRVVTVNAEAARIRREKAKAEQEARDAVHYRDSHEEF